MKSLILIPVLMLGTAGLVFADTAATDTAPCGYSAVLPAHTKVVEREVTIPPVRCMQRVPRYATVQIPVYDTRRVPVYEEIERPVFETFEVPVYRTERVPVWGTKEVPVYRSVSKPVTVCLPNPFTCCDTEIELWDECEEVPCGTKTVRAIVDYEARQVECGTRTERRQTGTRTERVLTGYRCERYQVGTREARRYAGCELREVVIRPAQTRIVKECVIVPARCVTVIPDTAPPTQPLAGTETVMTESAFERALAEAGKASEAAETNDKG